MPRQTLFWAWLGDLCLMSTCRYVVSFRADFVQVLRFLNKLLSLDSGLTTSLLPYSLCYYLQVQYNFVALFDFTLLKFLSIVIDLLPNIQWHGHELSNHCPFLNSTDQQAFLRFPQ